MQVSRRPAGRYTNGTGDQRRRATQLTAETYSVDASCQPPRRFSTNRRLYSNANQPSRPFTRSSTLRVRLGLPVMYAVILDQRAHPQRPVDSLAPRPSGERLGGDAELSRSLGMPTSTSSAGVDTNMARCTVASASIVHGDASSRWLHVLRSSVMQPRSRSAPASVVAADDVTHRSLKIDVCISAHDRTQPSLVSDRGRADWARSQRVIERRGPSNDDWGARTVSGAQCSRSRMCSTGK